MTVSARPHQRLPRATLSTQIAEQLRDDILTGVLLPDTQLNEKELALSFGVSRGPLREAMQRLIQEGIVRSEPHRGVFVTGLSEDDLTDVFFVRTALESAAIERVLSLGNREEVANTLVLLSEKMEAAVRAKRWKEGGELDFEYHRALVDSAGSERLSRTYATVQAETRLCLHRLMGGYRSSVDLADEHFELAEAIRNQPFDAILQELHRHFGDPVAIMRRSQQRKGPAE